MKTITFISHYNKQEMNVRLSDDKAEKFLNNMYYNPIELYHHDHDRVSAGEEPKFLSKGQVKKLDNYLHGIEYWDKVEIRK